MVRRCALDSRTGSPIAACNILKPCVGVAWLFFHQQQRTSAEVGENESSYGAAVKLKSTHHTISATVEAGIPSVLAIETPRHAAAELSAEIVCCLLPR